MRKHKIIDTIFLYDEIEMLYFRLSELEDFVDEFIIMECEMDFKGNPKPLNYLQNVEMFEKWKDKITYISTPKIDLNDIKPLYDSIKFGEKLEQKNNDKVKKNDLRFFQISTLIGSLLDKNLDYDDLILISDVDEIPDLSKSQLFKPHLKFGAILLRQTNFIWSTKYYNPIPNTGTIGFQFSRLITTPDIVYRAYFNKTLSSNSNFEIIDNGFHLSHFYSLEKTINKLKLLYDSNFEYPLNELENKVKYFYENLMSTKRNFENQEYSLIEYNGPLPTKIHLLKNQSIGREWSKRNLILFNVDEPLQIQENFDSVSIINFTDEFKIYKKTNEYNILKPNVILYETEGVNNLDEFQKVFCFNEIKKIIHNLHPIKKDLFVFINSEFPKKSLTFTWEQIENNFIYDLIKEIT